jgi:hypothetical protein
MAALALEVKFVGFRGLFETDVFGDFFLGQSSESWGLTGCGGPATYSVHAA